MKFSGTAGIFCHRIGIGLAPDCTQFFCRLPACGLLQFHIGQDGLQRSRMERASLLRLGTVFGCDILKHGVIRIVFERFWERALEGPALH